MRLSLLTKMVKQVIIGSTAFSNANKEEEEDDEEEKIKNSDRQSYL